MQTTHQDAFDKCESLVVAIIGKISGTNKRRRKFMLHLFLLFMGLRGRFNFLNMARYGKYDEQSYRNNFSEDFDFLSFNKELINQSCSAHKIIAFDPSYIPKSGKHTEHLGWFWSGTSGKAMKGLEIGGLAVIDVENNTAMSLEAIQTPVAHELKKKEKSMVDHYAQVIIERKDTLQPLSDYLAVDGYFAKERFIIPILKNTSLHIIGKLRTDANLWYPYLGEHTGKRGRPKSYTEKVAVKSIDKKRITLCYQNEDTRVYEGIVYSKMLGCKIKIAYIERWKDSSCSGEYAILFSTDLHLRGDLIYLYYKSRYQIEFLFRDAKQHCGLTHCQARDEKKLYFHFNASLTTVSLAKAIYYLPLPKEQRQGFSMSTVKTLYLNKIIAERIFANLELDMNQQKIQAVYQDALFYGSIRSRAA
jgi:hypothetical protein